MTKEIRNLVIIAVVVVLALGIGIWAVNRSDKANPPQQQTGQLVRDDSNQTNKGAKVTVVEFGDFQCPACGASAPAVEAMLAKYKDNKDFNFVFRNFPLPQHQNAQISAEAAEAAGAQGKYWEMYSKLYAGQSEWSQSVKPLDVFVQYAKDLNLDVNKFGQAVTDSEFAAKIKEDQDDGIALGINSTPTFYVNGKQFVGVPGDDFTKAVDSAIMAK